jgi:uncharacterized metal-binding protein YceD (DUF177 family)
MFFMRYRLHKLLSGPVGMMQVEQLDRGPTCLDNDLQVAYLCGQLTFTRLNEAIMVEGTVDTAVTVQCVRSLEDFSLCLSIPLKDVLFSLPHYFATDLPPDAQPEPERRVSDDGWIDLTETLREEIIMAIPINPISPKYAEAGDFLPEGLDESDRDWLTVKWSNAEQDRARPLVQARAHNDNHHAHTQNHDRE